MAVGIGFALPMQPTRWSNALCSIEQEFVARAPPYRCVKTGGNRPALAKTGVYAHMRPCVRACGCACRYAVQPCCSLGKQHARRSANRWSCIAPRLQRPRLAKSAVRGAIRKDRQSVLLSCILPGSGDVEATRRRCHGKMRLGYSVVLRGGLNAQFGGTTKIWVRI